MANEGIELEVYRYSAPLVKVKTLYGRVEPQFLRQLNAQGGASFKISRNDPDVLADPTLLDYRNIIKFKIDGKIQGAMKIQTNEFTYIGQGEKKEEAYAISGPGLRTWFDDATVYPYEGLQPGSADKRAFNFATERGSWYDATKWTTPFNVGKLGGSAWAGMPKDWPANAGSYWMWGTNIVYPNSAVNGSSTLFRWEVTITTASLYRIYSAGDDFLEMWIDGSQVITTDKKATAFTKANKTDYYFTAGAHVLSFKVTNQPNGLQPSGNPAAFMAAMYRVDENNAEIKFGISDKNDARWKCYYNPPTMPGWSSGEILLKLIAEAKARGVTSLNNYTFNFDATYDSNGETWDKIDWSLDVGKNLSSVIAQMEELHAYLVVDPDTYRVDFMQERGEARDAIQYAGDGVTVTQVPVIFNRGKNLLKASGKGVGHITSSLAMKTADGWYISNNAASASQYGRIEDSLDAGDSSYDLAQSLAQVLFDQRAYPEEGAVYDIIPVPGAVPLIDFFEGDWVLAPDKNGTLVSRRVMSITVGENAATGAKTFTLEFDTIWQEIEERVAYLAKKTSGGSAGGSMANSPSSPTVINPPQVIGGDAGVVAPTFIPKYPISISATSVGKWQANGIVPFSEVTITWQPVTANTDGSETIPLQYEVQAYPTNQGVDATQTYAVTSDSSAVINLTPGIEWNFSVRTTNPDGTQSAWSPIYTYTPNGPSVPLDKPSTPTLSTALGLLTVTWDGKLLSSGGPIDPPAQFRYTRIEVSPHATDNWKQMGSVFQRGGGTASISGLTVGQVYDVRLVAIDGSGLASAPTVDSMKIRTNLISDPNTTLAAGRWSWPAAAVTSVTIVGGKLRMVGNGTSVPYVYPTVQVGAPAVAGRYAINAGQRFTVRAEVTNPLAVSMWVTLGVSYYNSTGGGSGAQNIPARVEVQAGQTKVFEHTGIAVNGTTTTTGLLPLLYLYGNAAGQATAGATIDSTFWQLEIGDSLPTVSPFPFWSGASADTASADYAWLTTVNGSPSTMTPLGNSITVSGVDLGDLDEQVSDAIDAANEAAIAAASTSGLLLDPSFEENPLTHWALLDPKATQVLTNPRTGTHSIKLTTGAAAYAAVQYLEPIPIDDEQNFLLRLWVRAAATSIEQGVEIDLLVGPDLTHMTTVIALATNDTSLSTTYTKISGEWQVPLGLGYRFAVPVITVRDTTGTNIYYIDDMAMYRQTSNDLLVDGAVTADKIAAESVVAGKIAAGAIAAVNIQASAITADKMAANSVTAEAIVAGSITSDKIVAGSIEAVSLSPSVGDDLDISANDTVTIIAGQIGDVSDGLDDTQSNLAEMQTYYAFGADGAIISKPGSPFSVALRSDRIEMLENGNVVSYWNSGQMYVNDLVGTKVILGNHQLEQYNDGTVVRTL